MRFCLSRLKSWFSRTFASRGGGIQTQSELMERLSHELRTSLTGIVGYSEFVESSSTEPMVNFTAKIIHESSQGLARAINSFFDLHRLSLGQIKISCSTFLINRLVWDVVRHHQKQALQHDVNLIYTCSKETFLLEMYTDAQRVRQVVDALIFGAVQSAAKGKSVHVDASVDETQSYFQLTVLGLDVVTDIAQINLLQEFWCTDRYKFRLQEGPGVELALAKALIYFLQGSAQYRYVVNESSQLIVKLPMRCTQTKVSV